MMQEWAKKPWEKISEKLVFNSYRKIISRLFRLPDGRELDYEVFTGQSFVVIAAFTESGKAIITKQYRPGPECFLWGFPSGMIDEGEQAADAAKRELLEGNRLSSDNTYFYERSKIELW